MTARRRARILEPYLVDVRTTVVSIAVTAGVTAAASSFQDHFSVALLLGGVAGAVIGTLGLRRRKQRFTAVARVVQDPSSSASAFEMLLAVKRLVDADADTSQIRTVIEDCVHRRRHPHLELAAPILHELDSAEPDLELIAALCETALDARPRVRTAAVRELARCLVGLSANRLILYGYSSTVCDGILAAAKSGMRVQRVLIVRDQQYGEGSVDEHEIAKTRLTETLTEDCISVVEEHQLTGAMNQSDDPWFAIIGGDAVSPSGEVLIPAVVKGQRASTAGFLRALDEASERKHLLIALESFKACPEDFNRIERTGAPLRVSRSLEFLFKLGIAAPLKIERLELLRLPVHEYDILVSDAGAMDEDWTGEIGPALQRAWEKQLNGKPSPQKQRLRRAVPYSHVIFDCNGVLVDDEVEHYCAFAAVVSESTGKQLAWDDYQRLCQGLTDEEGVRALKNEDLLSHRASTANLMARKRHHYNRETADGPILIPGTRELLTALSDCGTVRHLLTSSDDEWLKRVLSVSGIDSFFNGRVRASVPHHARMAEMKHIATESGVAPRRVLVIDDSPRNLAMAAALGLPAIQVANRTAPTSTVPGLLASVNDLHRVVELLGLSG